MKEEKEDLLNQMRVSSEMNDQALLSGLSEDELRSQN